jgi:hypothetical protein
LVIANQVFAQVDEGNITTFEDGTPAVADEVNANFQALVDSINSLADRVGSLESSSNNSQGFSGSYTLTGMGASMDCSGGNAIAITIYGISGTGTATNGELSYNLTEKGMDPVLRDDGNSNFVVDARSRNLTDSGTLSFDSNGVFSGIDGGSFSADGSAFVLSNSTADCSGDVTHLVGVRN